MNCYESHVLNVIYTNILIYFTGKVPVLSTIYAPNNTGLNIGKAKVPWERGRFGRSKKNRKNKYSNKKKIGKKFGTKLLGN